jgi:hypothetical protein
MTMIFVKFKTAVHATIMALVLAGAILPAVSTLAQEAAPFSLNLGIAGGGGAASMGATNNLLAPIAPRSETGTPQAARCLTNREIRRGIAANGYSRVEIKRDLAEGRVEVAGQNGNWLYSMRVDKCSGEVDRVERVRRVQGGGFGLQFN